MLRRFVCIQLILLTIFNSTIGFAESIEDKFTQIAPSHSPGSGEFVHGQGYGKILIRVLVFGAVPQQGVHYFPEGTDLLFGILYAGGYSEITKLDEISIRRKGQKDLIEVDLESVIDDGEKVPKLQDGDVVTVPFNWRKDVATITTITGFITAMTGFTLSLIALSK